MLPGGGLYCAGSAMVTRLTAGADAGRRGGGSPGAVPPAVAPSALVDAQPGGDDARSRRLRRGAADPTTPVLRSAGRSPAVSVDAESGAVTAVAVVGGPDAGQGRRVILRFGWEPADPLAVAIDIETRPDHPALPRGRWVVLRDFLRYGLSEPTGDGDVRICPAVEQGVPVVTLVLARTVRPCTVIVPAPVLDAFLRRTEATVPLGGERSDALVDQLIARLLDS